MGSASVLTDSVGAVLERMSYDVWGNVRNVTNESDLVLKSAYHTKSYTGHEALADVDLVHMNGRIYDPTLGRFMSADPFVQFAYNSQSYNRYSYVLNNPLGFVDPSGYMSEETTGEVTDSYEGEEVTWTETTTKVGTAGGADERKIGNDGGNDGAANSDLNFNSGLDSDSPGGDEPELGAAIGHDGDGDSDNDGIPDSVDDEDNVEGIIDPSIKGPALHPGGAGNLPVKGATQNPPKGAQEKLSNS